ncbi:MarR family winged helix-turn-helix transcriptional regulator [Labrys monachus]|uniref:DNA-binding MarR family transcriptional regulator n=1 Tax=Labrys monachus TaxID=217067 RepID=A0ABU0FGP7_9HYPH|nr:MarR family winged helix-turn-helix transcriptional regulator [Labrys monachus]MDQ0393775.1 DNA-binding MarR family transcriptional regulator [Labrys monachus]
MDELIDLLAEVSSGFQLRLNDLNSPRELKLAPFQARLLAVIGRRPGCSQQELAARTGRDKAQVARTIKELKARGFLARSAHASDWRSHSLTVTAEGERASALISRDRAALGIETTLDLTPEERRVMIQALAKMKRRLVAVDAGPERS